MGVACRAGTESETEDDIMLYGHAGELRYGLSCILMCGINSLKADGATCWLSHRREGHYYAEILSAKMKTSALFPSPADNIDYQGRLVLFSIGLNDRRRSGACQSAPALAVSSASKWTAIGRRADAQHA